MNNYFYKVSYYIDLQFSTECGFTVASDVRDALDKIAHYYGDNIEDIRIICMDDYTVISQENVKNFFSCEEFKDLLSEKDSK